MNHAECIWKLKRIIYCSQYACFPFIAYLGAFILQKKHYATQYAYATRSKTDYAGRKVLWHKLTCIAICKSQFWVEWKRVVWNHVGKLMNLNQNCCALTLTKSSILFWISHPHHKSVTSRVRVLSSFVALQLCWRVTTVDRWIEKRALL